MRIFSAALVAAMLASAACSTHPQHACDASRAEPTVVVRVADDSDYMKQTLAHVGMAADGSALDPAAKAANVRAMIDRWDAISDEVLVAPDRAALEHYVATLAPIPPGHAIAYGHDAAGWRTYYVDTKPILTNADFAAGVAQGDGVLLTLTHEGAKKFDAASTAAVGHKLAFMVGDRIESAPVINTPIRGGALQITPGPHDHATPLLDRLACR